MPNRSAPLEWGDIAHLAGRPTADVLAELGEVGVVLMCGHRIPATGGVRVWNYYDGRWTVTADPVEWSVAVDTSCCLPHGITWWFADVDLSRATCEACAHVGR